MGPGDLTQLIRPVVARAGDRSRVLVGPESSDDAGVYLLEGTGIVATADFITPVCDDPRRFGRVAAANSISDIFAMGGEPLFGLNLCFFPEEDLPEDVPAEILAGGAEILADCDAALLGGHSVRDEELKYGLAVVGRVDPEEIFSNDRVRPGDALVLTKPLGTGVLINAFKAGTIDAEGLEAALVEMERLNGEASGLAREHGAHTATDVTGFGFAGHALNLARGSGLRLEIEFEALPVHDSFFDLVSRGITTGCTEGNRNDAVEAIRFERRLSRPEATLLYDPQTSGGLLVALPEARASGYLEALRSRGHNGSLVGHAVDAEPGLTIR